MYCRSDAAQIISMLFAITLVSPLPFFLQRSKAEVDQEKLREIEMRDEQLAAIIQEQERMKERKYKLKRQQQKEQQRFQVNWGQAFFTTLLLSYNFFAGQVWVSFQIFAVSDQGKLAVLIGTVCLFIGYLTMKIVYLVQDIKLSGNLPIMV